MSLALVRASLGASVRAAGRGLRPASAGEASALVALLLSALLMGGLELAGLSAAVRLSRKALLELPHLIPTYLLQRLLAGFFTGTGLLLVLGALTTAVSTLFLAEDLPFRQSLPIPHRSLLARQLQRTIALASGPSLLLAAPAILVAMREAPRPFLAGATLGTALVAVLVGAGALGASLSLLLVLAFPPRRARLLAGFLSAAGLAVALLGLRGTRPERLFDPVAALDLLERLGTRAPGPPGLDPLARAARAATQGLAGDPSGLAEAGLLLAVALLGTSLLARLLAPLHLRLLRVSREEGGAGLGSSRPAAPVSSLGRLLVRAEWATLARDAGTPAQLGTLVAVFVLDLLNLHLLPTADAGARDLVAGLQTALALFLVSALSLRFAFPAVSSDGRAALLLRTLPLSSVRHLLARLLVRGVPSLAASMALVGISLWVLRPGAGASAAALVAGAVGGIALPALHLGLGAVSPRYDVPDAIAVALGPGGLFALTLSTGLALVPVVFVSDGTRGLLEALSGLTLERVPLLALWTLVTVASGVGALAMAVRTLPRRDVTGG